MNTPKFKPGQRIVRREMPHDTFTIDRIEKDNSGRWYYIMKNTVLGYITGVDEDFIDADSLEGVWLRV